MKKRLLAVLLIACMVFGLTACKSGTQDGGTGADAEDVFEDIHTAMDNMVIGYNIGNSLDSNGSWIAQYTDGKPSDYETSWGNPVVTKKFVDGTKELGYNVVRIPVTWAEHLDEDGTVDEAWMTRVQQVVDYAVENDMYCIINIHHDCAAGDNAWIQASTDNYEKNKDRVAYLVQQIAETFKDYDEHLLFEGFNEMLDENNNWGTPSDDAMEAINLYNQLFVDTVRATGGNNSSRNLIVASYADQNSGKALEDFVMPADSAAGDHIAAEVHVYSPNGFIHAEEANWYTWTDVFDEAGQAEIDTIFESIRTNLTDKGYEVIIGEWGSADKNNTEERVKWATYTAEKAKEQGILLIYWDASDYALLYRMSGNSKFPEITDALMQEYGR